VRVQAHGRECRVTLGDMLWCSQLFRDGMGDALEVTSTGTLQNFIGYGWALVSDNTPPLV
jgi:hypothetical protein